MSYIGATSKTLKQRWRVHLGKMNSCRGIKEAIAKFGKASFDISELAYCETKEEAYDLETYFIGFFKTLYPSGYNLRIGGNPHTWTKERIIREASKYTNRIEFQKAGYAYWAAMHMGILQEVCAHMPVKSSAPPVIWTKERILSELKKLGSFPSLKKNNKSAYNAMYRQGLSRDVKTAFSGCHK